MECKRCGGIIDPATDRCRSCGEYAHSDMKGTIVRSIDELAEYYGLNTPEDNSELPQLFSMYEEKITRRAQVMREAADAADNSTKGNPTIGLSEYERLLGGVLPEEIPDAPIEKDRKQQKQPQERECAAASLEQKRPERETPGILKAIDSIIEKPANRVLDLYYSKHPRPSRVQSSGTGERLAVLAGVLAAAAVVIVLACVIIGSIAPDVTGKWLIAETSSGERLTIEFTRSKDVTVYITSGDTENVYQTGSYKVRRSNGYNLLTITYDDGSEKRLYYTLDRDAGTFTNVDTNNSDVYIKVK